MKSRDVLAIRGDGIVHADGRIEAPVAGFAPEGVHAVGAERMPVTEAVTFQIIAEINADRLVVRHC